MPEFIYLLCGLMTGLVLGYVIFRKKEGAAGGQTDLLFAEARRFETQWQQVVKENEKLELALSEVRHELLASTARAASLEGNTEALKLQWEQRLKEQEEYRKQLKQEFENLANRIFEEKGKTFAEQNRNNLDLILNPLKEKITAFEKTVHDTYEKETKDSGEFISRNKNTARVKSANQ
jgi:DNA recombination protein RmuC